MQQTELARKVLNQVRTHNSQKVERDGRGRNASYLAPPAQIPACATNAPGSCLR